MTPNDHVNAKGEPHCAVALAGGATYQEAATAGGVALATIKRRMADGPYRVRVQQLRAQLLEQALGVLADNCTAAVLCLTDLLHGESEMVRQKTARTILEMSMRMRREVEFEARVCKIERSIEVQRADRERRYGR